MLFAKMMSLDEEIMTEGEKSPTLYHIENNGTLNITPEQNHTSMNGCFVGSFAVDQTQDVTRGGLLSLFKK